VKIDLESRIIEAVNARGPLLGRELMAALDDAAYLDVWRACFGSGFLQISHFARYYLRFDVTREDYIRLSPSILRDFLTFTLISLPHQREQVIERQIQLSNQHREISVYKLKVARQTVMALSQAARRDVLANGVCFVAGDIAYYLAHNEPRENAALGKMVQGSDVDIVVVFRDGFDPKRIAEIDEEMLEVKHYILRSTNFREEVDFVVKTEEKMRTQLGYGDIHQKIASKILYESLFLAGDFEFYSQLKSALGKSGTEAKINADFEAALDSRKHSMKRLLNSESGIEDKSIQSLFFFSQERLEFT